MIFKVRKHRSKRHLRILVRYLLSRKGESNERVLRHESINALPMLPGETPLSYAKQWAAALWEFTARERCGKKPPEDYFVHSVLSFFPGDTEHKADQLTAEQAIELAKEAMVEVAPGDRQAMYVVHGDKAHLHVHIVFSVVERGGRIWNPRMDFRLWEAAAARLEVKHGLYQVTVGRPGGEPARKRSPTGNELNMAIRTGQPSNRMLLQQIVDVALAGNPPFPVFWQRLLDAGVTPIPRIASTGRVSGISFQYGDGFPMKGSDLGKGYSWSALAKQLNFAPSQHLHLLRPFAVDPVDPGSIHTEADPSVPALPQGKPPTLKRFIAKSVSDQRIDWVWRNKPTRTAFIESPKVCVARSAHQSVYEAMAERSRLRRVKRVGVTGGEVFRRRMWFELALRGISVVGYEPTEADRFRLEWWMNEQAENGRGDGSAGGPTPDGGDVSGPLRKVGCHAEGKSVDQRGTGGGDVPVASGHDITGTGEPGAAQGNACVDAQRGSGNEGGNERASSDVDGAQNRVEVLVSAGAGLSPEPHFTPYMRRASCLGKAALLRQGVHSALETEDLQTIMDMVWELDRRFTRWSIACASPGNEPLCNLTASEQVHSAWSNLQVLNSQGCNVQLSLSSADSWLHLVNVTEADLLVLSARGIEPTIQFTRNGVTEIFVHVNYGCELRDVMDSLAEQVQVGLQASVRAHIGSVSFPLPGFDCWHDEQLQLCSAFRLTPKTMGMQFSSQLRQLKGEVGPPRMLGAVPIQRSHVMDEQDEGLLNGRPRPQPESPAP
ncbi:relaxase/mobilization nuclease domain-containing protein [Pseudomonas aeruginosa]|uniref:relaxase/mobilization nuclease domain-containing protein n=1 Tax=Pseudomonas aeruginosa TaxID=287 RepID=UPI0015954A3E|nr:relaxase/mobilization nuclease domain-containing protein [Pseudomonas aeruginosa]